MPDKKYRLIKVYVSDDDLFACQSKAAASGMSTSAFMRNCGLRREVLSRFDKEFCIKLLKIAADQARLGGLFKLYLTKKNDPEVAIPELNSMDVQEIIRELRAIQVKIMQMISTGRPPNKDDS